MQRFSTWEFSSLNFGRKSDHHSHTAVVHSAPGRDELSVLSPSLPPLQLLSHEESEFLFPHLLVDTDADQTMMHRPTVNFRSISPDLYDLPFQDRNFTDSSMLSQTLDETKGEFELQDTKTYHHVMHTIHPLRQGSDSSTHSRSKYSDASSRQSRPSSRSSFEGCAIPTKPCNSLQSEHESIAKQVTRQLYSESASPKSTLESLSHQIRSTGSPIRGLSSNQATTTDSSRKREDEELTEGPVSRGSSRLSYHDLSTFKRGARLGRQIVGNTHEPWIKPIVIPFQPNDLPAIKVREPKKEKAKKRDDTSSPRRRNEQQIHSDDIPSEIVQRILLSILENAPSIDDIQSLAMVNKGFYHVFKLHERDIVSKVLFEASPALWELRQVLKCEQKRGALKLRSLKRDIATITALQSFILMSCPHICRASTVNALLDDCSAAKTQLETALWRIATFCKLFGKTNARYDVKSQILWLKGGGRRRPNEPYPFLGVGNGDGLSVRELEDMSEMWHCLESLLSGFRNREAEAKKNGVFDNCVIDHDEAATERYFLEAWIQDLLCLGPKAVLTLSSCSFEQARVLGVTRWSPPTHDQSKRLFLKGAIEDVYRESLMAEARNKAFEFAKQIRSRPELSPVNTINSARSSHINSLPQELSVVNSRDQATLTASSQQLSASSEYSPHTPQVELCLPRSNSFNTTSPSTMVSPIAFTSLSMTPNASARMGATLFPVQKQPNGSGRCSQVDQDLASRVEESVENRPEILDPVDRAMAYLVKELGFSEVKARQALAMCDDGTGIDTRRAIELLTVGTDIPAAEEIHSISELPAGPIAHSPRLPYQVDAQCIAAPYSASPQHYNSIKKRNRLNTSSLRKAFPLGIIMDAVDEQESGDEVHDKKTPQATVTNKYQEPVIPTTHRLVDSVKLGLQHRNSISKLPTSVRRIPQNDQTKPGIIKASGSSDQVRPAPRQLASVTGRGSRADRTPTPTSRTNEISNIKARAHQVMMQESATKKKMSRGWSFREPHAGTTDKPSASIGCAF